MKTNRLVGVVIAVIGAVIGETLHQNNISTSLLTSQSIWINALWTLLFAGIVGIAIGNASNAFDIFYQKRALSRPVSSATALFTRRAGYVLRAGVFGGCIAFLFIALAYWLSGSSGVDVGKELNWLWIVLMFLAYIGLGIVSGVSLSVWLLIQRQKLIDKYEQLLKDITVQVAQALGVPIVSEWVLNLAIQVEKGILTNFWKQLNAPNTTAPSNNALIDGAPSDTALRVKEKKRMNPLLKAFLVILGWSALAGLGLGIVLFLPTLWIDALITTRNIDLSEPIVLGVLVGLLAGLAAVWVRRSRTSGDVGNALVAPIGADSTIAGFFVTGSLIGAFSMALLINTFHQSSNVLHGTFSHGVVGLALGFVIGGSIERMIRTAGTQRGKSTREALGAIAGTIAVLLLCCGLSAGAVKYFTSLNTNTSTVDVSSVLGWQDTDYYVKAGDTVTLQYQSGSWTETNGVVDPTDANGIPDNPPDYLYCLCGEPLPGMSTQALIGKVGDSGTAFLVGDMKTFTATASGDIFLRMNDRDSQLGDNSGDLEIRITTVQPTATPGVPTATPTRVPSP
jgi:hypothetical protein